MNKSKGVTILLTSIILFMLLQVLRYENYQYAVQQEQNMLYSPHNKLVINKLENIRTDIEDDYRVFCEFNEKDQTIRGYYSNDYKVWVPPIRIGEFFTDVNTEEAIVGEEVYKRNKNEYEYNGKRYKIIGVFTNYTSYLENMVLINDTSLFLAEEQQIIIDSTNKIQSGFDSGSSDYGLNTVDSSFLTQNGYMYAVKWLGIGLVTLAIFFLVNIFCVSFQKQNYIEYLLGKSLQRIKYKNLLYLLITYLIIFLFIFNCISMPAKLKADWGIWGCFFLIEEIIIFLFIMRRRGIYVSN